MTASRQNTFTTTATPRSSMQTLLFWNKLSCVENLHELVKDGNELSFLALCYITYRRSAIAEVTHAGHHFLFNDCSFIVL